MQVKDLIRELQLADPEKYLQVEYQICSCCSGYTDCSEAIAAFDSALAVIKLDSQIEIEENK